MGALARTVIASLLIWTSLNARAQNLLTNGDFDNPPGNLSGWVAAGQTVPIWDGSENCCGGAGSGSVFLSGTSTGAQISQCVPVVDTHGYDLKARVEGTTVGTNPFASFTTMAIYWFAGLGCAGSVLDLQVVSQVIPAPWTSLGFSASPPSGTGSASIVLSVPAASLSTSPQAHWDGVAFGPTGTVPVTLESFSVD
jgi:hypothetical protein